ncbi:hypothetical protein [Candidatus Xianfuyuplasma coldseepsis]|uniref:Uncharacterized protein n=1 Tax=Candidatus Xianfuyuplasma coldseepsis TaxID=2782163 RepID=A0A7L7KR03_9MOLU|nr:hypothetical protein [Xianfuyuplasma coldseepsis]QMS84859.1 hypothetical protein G4Z02_03520 [Xianfuyuplasma coldseepsis]
MTIARVLGYAILVFFILASLNGAKRYTKNTLVRAIAKQHQIYAGIAVLLALVHLIVNVSNNNLSPTGLITLLLLIATGVMGALFKHFKKRNLYLAHRILGPLAFVSALIHVLTNLLA